ncbi:hypothetical protein LJR153_007230 [Paenibacillus sp. LjRoot153]|uniref:DNA sulfur modification protein DndB n=1 Tax=Paenibacillus sp. LjRoot153 TaxID=3342270 RepID=UPI003ECD8286
MNGLRLNMAIHPVREKFGLATIAIQVQDLLNYIVIDPLVQRKLNALQRKKIAAYLQERELDRIFFGPVALSLREVNQLTKDEKGLILMPGSKLSVLDGQHRILALSFVNEQIQKEVRSLEKKLALLKVKKRRFPNDIELNEETIQTEGSINQLEQRRLELMESSLATQIYIGLSEEQECQLFGDINSKVQLVSKELGHAFDSIDPINLIIQQVVSNNIYLKAAGVERRGNLTSFNKNFTSFSWLYSITTMLFRGKMQSSFELTRSIRNDPSTYIEILHQFFTALLPFMPEQPGLPQYISSGRVVQESIALYAHGHLFKDGIYQQDWLQCMVVFEDYNWSHENFELIELFGKQDNGKINLIHEKSLRKHSILVDHFTNRQVTVMN